MNTVEIFIRGGQCLFVVKYFLVRGSVISWINFLKKCLYIRLWGCKCMGNGYQRKPRTVVLYEQWWFHRTLWITCHFESCRGREASEHVNLLVSKICKQVICIYHGQFNNALDSASSHVDITPRLQLTHTMHEKSIHL